MQNPPLSPKSGLFPTRKVTVKCTGKCGMSTLALMQNRLTSLQANQYKCPISRSSGIMQYGRRFYFLFNFISLFPVAMCLWPGAACHINCNMGVHVGNVNGSQYDFERVKVGAGGGRM